MVIIGKMVYMSGMSCEPGKVSFIGKHHCGPKYIKIIVILMTLKYL